MRPVIYNLFQYSTNILERCEAHIIKLPKFPECKKLFIRTHKPGKILQTEIRRVLLLCGHRLGNTYSLSQAPIFIHHIVFKIQQNFSGSNTDGSSTTAVSNSFLSPLKKSHSSRLRLFKGIFAFYIENGMLCVLIRIASLRRF